MLAHNSLGVPIRASLDGTDELARALQRIVRRAAAGQSDDEVEIVEQRRAKRFKRGTMIV